MSSPYSYAVDSGRSQHIQSVKDPARTLAMSDFAQAINLNFLVLPSTKLTDTMVDYFSHDHVDHQTETNSDHPSTSTTSTQEQSPEATTAVERVLGPFDVLLLVISEAPLRERTSIRLVSKAWRYAVDRLALKPVGYDCWKSEAVPSVPIYQIDPDDGELRLNCYSGLARHMLRPNMARTKGFTRTHMPIGPRQVVLRLEDCRRSSCTNTSS